MRGLFLQGAIVTRPEITHLTKSLFVIFIFALGLWGISSLIFTLIKKGKKKYTKMESLSYMILSILSEISLFISGAILVIMISLLATIENDVSLKDYQLYMNLVAFFSSVLSFGILMLLSRFFLKKKRFKGITYQKYLASVGVD